MESNKLNKKSRAIIAGLAKGRSCEQILAADPTLTYHDIFRAAAEMSENQRHLKLSFASAEKWRLLAESGGRPAKIGSIPKARD